jgi:hypothetical protein
MRSLTAGWLAAALIVIFCRQLSAQKSDEIVRLYLKESTFQAFSYQNGSIDEKYTEVLKAKTQQQFSDANTIQVASYVTMDKPRTVVYYYANLCGQRFLKEGDRFTYVFSEIDGRAATRVEIYSMEIGRIHSEFWPTRINLFVIQKPLYIAVPDNFVRSAEELKKRIGAFFYQGKLLEDVARLEMEEIGPGAEVYIIDTEDDFETVHLFFRRLYGAFYVRTSMDGDLFTRDFEIDISHVLGGDDLNRDLFVSVEENPVVIDQNSNSHVYRGHVFIKYTFWKKTKEELKQMRLESNGD